MRRLGSTRRGHVVLHVLENLFFVTQGVMVKGTFQIPMTIVGIGLNALAAMGDSVLVEFLDAQSRAQGFDGRDIGVVESGQPNLITWLPKRNCQGPLFGRPSGTVNTIAS